MKNGALTSNGYEWRGSSKERETKIQTRYKEKVGAEGIDYIVMLRDKSLGAECSMSKIGIP